jgi:hypothetical protein
MANSIMMNFGRIVTGQTIDPAFVIRLANWTSSTQNGNAFLASSPISARLNSLFIDAATNDGG